ncbi:MAG: PQQ-binding-like beta-propeller repeat protein, partial [Limisphaerales bacterium]
MHRMPPKALILSALLYFSAAISRADDWPQWLGPQRDSVWRESGVLERFPATGASVVWRAAVGAGYSGPVVAQGRVYVTDRQLAPDVTRPSDPFQRGSLHGVERVLCLSEADGKELWHYDYDCAYTVSYAAGPRVAPLVNAGKVYSLGAEGNLMCLDAVHGEPIWSKDLKADYHVKAPLWGFASHPLLDGNRLICLVGGEGSTVVALDKDSGKEIWRALSASEPGYSSPTIFEIGGKRQLMVFEPDAVNSLDPKTGRVFWSVPFKSNSGLCVATPRQ